MAGAIEPVQLAVERENHRLAGETIGDGPPIVLLHGLTATRRYVVHGSKVLARRGYRQISYDAAATASPTPPPGTAATRSPSW